MHGAFPSLIVVTGCPGSGKTTLAHSLARVVRCPALCRDEIKEGLWTATRETGEAPDAIARDAYGIFFDTIEFLLHRRVTLIAEAAFQHKLWAPKLEPLRTVANLRIICCSIDLQLARSRHITRGLADPARERFHPDPVMEAARQGRAVPINSYDPPDLIVPTLEVDTSDGYRPAFESILTFATA